MSDTFDHEGDAWASLDWANDADPWPYRSRPGRAAFVSDPLYYHTLLTFKELKAQTDKAYLVRTHGKEVWIPKKICRGFSAEHHTVYVHAKTFAKILNNACTIVKSVV